MGLLWHGIPLSLLTWRLSQPFGIKSDLKSELALCMCLGPGGMGLEQPVPVEGELKLNGLEGRF